MYIEPNTTIKILRNVPLDLTFDHTIWWNGAVSQTNYFSSKAKYTLDRQSYQRVQRGFMRVNIAAENLYDCNYIMFQNTAFGNKWFYAFLKSVEYVNNNVSQVEFIIDVMQTWYFDYENEACFIEREHSATDIIGDNLVPENLDSGDYVTDNMDGSGHLNEKSIVVAATFDGNYDNIGGSVYGGLFSGLYYNVFPNTTAGASAASSFILGAGTKMDGIVSVFYAPTEFITNVLESAKYYEITKTKNYSDIDGYVPKNKKLFTYPYNFLYVSNLQGKAASFPYEYFSGETCDFGMTGDFTGNPTVLLIPRNYKGAVINYDEMLSLGGFPQCAFATDAYRAWLAQSAATLPFAVAGNAVNAATGAAMRGVDPVSSIAVGTIGSIVSLCGENVVRSMQPLHSHGTQSGTTLAAVGALDFCFFHKHIRQEFAKIIDDYFTVYGYACHRVKIPNKNVRPFWTYTKTVGCKIVGSIPADDASAICKIYDNGITFWNNPADVGNYSLDNSAPV